jgi:hypothetical protein
MSCPLERCPLERRSMLRELIQLALVRHAAASDR